MEEIIAHAVDLVNKQLALPSLDRSADSYLVRLRNGLKQLLEPNLIKNDHVRLFCRQMNRLMDYNDSPSLEVWVEWHDDIAYLINGPNSYQLRNDSWERTIEKMKLEEKLEKYEAKFLLKFGKRKHLNEFLCEYRYFFQNYLRKCSSFHSTIEIRGLVGNMDEFFDSFDQKAGVSLTSQQRKSLEEKLQCIEIDLDCSNKSFRYSELAVPTQNNLNNFLPSTKQIEIGKYGQFKKIENILEFNRWIVILGDPGSSKTTVLRWITRFFAERALSNDQEFLRIPILIRIGEFAAWLRHFPGKTLMDYIGAHQWFSKPYCQDDGQTILQELVNHGHALILLDGLDEIPQIEQRGEIVSLVRDFIEEYVRAPDFTSAFNNKIIRRHQNLYYPETIETPLPSKSVGNQIIITSRFVGYQSNPLFSPFIEHYSLSSMELDETKEFVDKWMRLVEEKILHIFEHEAIQLHEEIREYFSGKRMSNIKSMFENKSKLLMSNPSLLSLICTIIFQSSDQLYFQSRAQLYDHIVQRSFSLWKKEQTNVSKDIFTQFLINLATYLHLHSQSGLIDTFDIKLLARLTLQQSNLSYHRRQLQVHANELIKLLENNVAFIVERGLQVYAFQHLSFQEYFVAQALLNHSSIAQIVQCVLSFAQDSRFHESLLLTISLISFKWSFNDYNQFCHDLLISTRNSSIPFGTLLLFHSFNDMKKLPSDAVIHTALNNLFNHSSMMITATYLLWNLPRVPNHIIVEWMQDNIKDIDSILNFCQCLFRKYPRKSERSLKSVQKLPSVVYQQLWSFHTRSLSIEFIIDQVLRDALVRDHATEQIFNQHFSSYLLSRDIHPLILSVITAVCGGIHYHLEDNILQISFSTKKMHRESSIFTPIIDYFNENNNEPHSRKIQILIDYYQNFLDNCSPSDTSTIVIDSFIALICLQGLSQTSIYQKYQDYQALLLALNRFKWNWFHFMISGLFIDLGTGYSKDVSELKSELKTILNLFSLQSNRDKKSFLVACVTAFMKLRAFDTKALFNIPSTYYYPIDQESSLHEKSLALLLPFLPLSLRKLYSCMILSSIDRTDSIPLVVFLLECLKQLNDTRHDDVAHYDGLLKLKPLLIEHSLGNYALAMFQDRYSDTKVFLDHPELNDTFYVRQLYNWQVLLDEERQRIYHNIKTMQNKEKDLRLFAASISLARLCQIQYKSYELHIQRQKVLSFPENKSIYLAITNISEPVLRIIAINTILDMNDPLIFNEEQRDQLRDEMLASFYSLLPNLSLLTSTFLFFQCHEERLFFPRLFQQISTMIENKFLQTSEDRDLEEQDAAFVALRQLNNGDLAFFLAQFAKRSNHLSDLLHFNSSIFHDYFLHTTEYRSCNSSLLAMMYLTELTFDVQNLRMYEQGKEGTSEKQFLLGKQFEQLWNESSRWKKIMTFKLAKWITDNLVMLTKTSVSFIIQCLSECVSIEHEALPIIQHWIKYKTKKYFQDFAQYAAIELLIMGSDNPDVIDILAEMLSNKNYSRIIFVADRLFNSSLIQSTIIHQILTALKENVRYLSKISIQINRQNTLELILQLQFEQLISNNDQQQNIPMRPLMLMINSCSKDLQIYLLQYIRTFITELVPFENRIKEEYISILLTWTIERIISTKNTEDLLNDLYEYIFTLIHNRRFPRIQQAIANALENIFSFDNASEHEIFMQNTIRIHLEKVISFWIIYPIDVLSICLLSYGNYLFRFQLRQQKNFQISSKMGKVLRNISKQFFPRIIFIRAKFCLIFSKDSKENRTLTLNQFKNEWNLTSEMEYQILVQNTLYRANNVHYGFDPIVQCFSLHPQMMKRLAIHVYDYLGNKKKKEWISDRIPDYLQITEFISDELRENFCDAVRDSSFGEENFKRKLYEHSKNHPEDRVKSIVIYSSFGILTLELLHMLDSLEETILLNLQNCFNNLTQISDREAVEKLFDLLNRKRDSSIFKGLLSILRTFVNTNVISLLEVHQKLPLIANISYESSLQRCVEEEHIFDFLLDISSFTNDRDVTHVQTILTTTDLIDTEFNQQINHFNNTLNLACGGRSPVGFLSPKRFRIRYST